MNKLVKTAMNKRTQVACILNVWLDKGTMSKDKIVDLAFKYSKNNHMIASEISKKPISKEGLQQFLSNFIYGVGTVKKYQWHHFVTITEHDDKYKLSSTD